MIRLLCLSWIVALSCVGLLHPYFNIFNSVIWLYILPISLSILLLDWRYTFFFSFKQFLPIIKLLAIFAMFATGWQYAELKLTQHIQQDIKTRQTVEGIVYIHNLSEGKQENWRQSAQLLIPAQQETLKILLYPKKIYNADNEVTGFSTDGFELGHFYRVTVDIKPPHGYVNPGGFDQEKWLLQQGIQGTATVLYSQEISPERIQNLGWYHFVVEQNTVFNRWKLWIEQLRLEYRMHLLAQNNNQNKALLLGLLTGDRSGIEQQMTLLYQTMGISHLLAISGPHVLILAAMLTWLMMIFLHCLMRYGVMSHLYQIVPRQYVYLPIFLLTVTFYVAFTGFEIPALRTWVIVLLCSLNLLFRIHVSNITLLLVTASLILLWDSFAVLSAAFWLSFVASAVLLLIYQQVQKTTDHTDTFWQKIINTIQLLWSSQWRIFVALLPVVLWQFKAIAFISPLINLLAIPFLSLIIVPLDIIAACIWQVIPILGDVLWSIAAYLLGIFNGFLHLISPVASLLYLPSYLTDITLLSLSIAIVILCLPSGLIPKYWCGLFLLPLLLPQHKPLLQLDVLDVGQGQSIFLQTQHHQMLIDTGVGAFSSGQMGMGARVIHPFLRSQGIRSIDEVILSHLDFDHSGGLSEIVQAMPVRKIRSNVFDENIIKSPQIPFQLCHQGQTWDWDNVKIEVLYPRITTDRSNANESSCVVLITAPMLGQTFKILIMGDVGWEGEYYIMQDFPALSVDVLVLGHHGSRHSSAYDFLAQMQPKLAVISAGIDNRYGHPTPQTLARLHALQIVDANTAKLGTIRFRLNDQNTLWQWHYQRAQRRWLLP